MKKNMYIIPATETLEVKAWGGLMSESPAKADPEHIPGGWEAPRKKVF